MMMRRINIKEDDALVIHFEGKPVLSVILTDDGEPYDDNGKICYMAHPDNKNISYCWAADARIIINEIENGKED